MSHRRRRPSVRRARGHLRVEVARPRYPDQGNACTDDADAGSARVAVAGSPQLEVAASEGMHEAAPVADEGGPGAVGPLHAQELHAAGVELDLAVGEQLA